MWQYVSLQTNEGWTHLAALYLSWWEEYIEVALEARSGYRCTFGSYFKAIEESGLAKVFNNREVKLL